MSGHSHFATIKRQKAANDAVKGNLFSKLARAIMIAAKDGPDPEMNFKLRVEIDKAKSMGLPKDNIERAIGKASGEGSSIEEITYEGFGPSGLFVIVNTATDNKNRTAQEIKSLFEKNGGRMGGPGSVAYNFDHKGYILVKKSQDSEDLMLKLIDFGISDMVEEEFGIVIFVEPHELSSVRKKIIDAGIEVLETELQMRPKMPISIDDPAQLEKIVKFLDAFDDHDDVSSVYSNLA